MAFAVFTPDIIPGQQPAEDALSTIAGQGILGALCVLLIVALFLAVRGLLKSKDERLDDQKEMGKALKDMNDATSKLAIESNRTSDGVKTALDNLVKSEKDLEDKVGAMERQQAVLVAAMPVKR